VCSCCVEGKSAREEQSINRPSLNGKNIHSTDPVVLSNIFQIAKEIWVIFVGRLNFQRHLAMQRFALALMYNHIKHYLPRGKGGTS